MSLDHALRLLPREYHPMLRSRARLGFVDHDSVCFDLEPERLNRVFAASGKVDGRCASDFVWHMLTMKEISQLFPGRVREIEAAQELRWREWAA